LSKVFIFFLLSDNIHTKGREHMNTLEDVIADNEKLLYGVISKYYRYAPKEDLYQVGVMGIINAYKNYDFKRKTKFSTYAHFYIVGEVKKYIRENMGLKVSRDIANLGAKIERVKELLAQKYNRTPNIEELSSYLEIDQKVVIEALQMKEYIRSLDEVINEDGKEMTLSDIIWVEEGYDKLDFINLKDGIRTLNNSEKAVIRNRYFEDRTQQETARILGLSQVQVSREEQRALDKLRNFNK
jgi:RNA polymerase sporulation-specific sigma factor